VVFGGRAPAVKAEAMRHNWIAIRTHLTGSSLSYSACAAGSPPRECNPAAVAADRPVSRLRPPLTAISTDPVRQ